MKMKKQFVPGFVSILFLFSLAGCSGSKNSEMANELHFSLEEISDVTISYDEEAITFYEADNDELVIKEYMTKNKTSYHADVTEDKNSIHISEGSKPFFKNGFSRHIEVYLPASYRDALTITTTDGNIDISDVDLQLSKLRIDSTAGTVKLNKITASDIYLSTTSGTLELGSISADTIRLDTTSGNITCDELTGNVTYTSTSGNADIKSAIGSGNYKANHSGTLNVTYVEVTGDLSLFNKNDDINLTLPADLEFEFEAASKNGSVTTTFEKYLSVDERTTSGTVGKNPTVTIKTETKNGNIEVSQ